MKISKHFTRAEMACSCGCGLDTMDIIALKIADEVRDYARHPITPTSACRCNPHNRMVGGSPDSQHPKCRAIDLPLDDPKKVYDYLCDKYPDRYGFGLYKTFVHIDSRNTKARW